MTDAELAIVVKLKDLFSKQLDQVVKDSGKAAKSLEAGWAGLNRVISTTKTIITGLIMGEMAKGTAHIFEFAAKVDLSTTGFKALSKMIGTDATEAMRRLREATEGEISDMDLMTTANHAVMLGAARTADELVRIAKAGEVLGHAMGMDAKEGIDALTRGLASQNERSLRLIGVIVNMEQVYEKLGITAANLSEKMKRELFEQEFWRKADESMAALGTETAGLMTQVERLTASWANFKTRLAHEAIPILQRTLEFWDEILRKMIAVEEQSKKIKPVPAGPTTYNQPYVGPGLEAAGSSEWEYPGVPNEFEKQKAFQEELTVKAEQAKKSIDLALEHEKKFRAAVEAGNRRAMGYPEEAESWLTRAFQTWEIRMEEAVTWSDRAWDAMAQGVIKYQETVSDTLKLVTDATKESFEDLERTISDVFFDAMIGKMKSFKDYLRGFLEDIARTISDKLAKKSVNALIDAIGGVIGGIIGGGSSQGLYKVGGIHDYAYGGITTGPSLSGEAGPEAVVPLPGDRAIPVRFTDGGRGAVTNVYNIYAMDTASFAAFAQRNRATLHKITAQGFSEDMQLRAAARAV